MSLAASGSSEVLPLAGDPQVSVHALSESLFCRRAALLGIEQGHDDEFDSDDAPRWDYAPFHLSQRQLARHLRQEFLILFASVLCVATFGVGTYLLVRNAWPWSGAAVAFLGLLAVINVLSTLRLIAALSLQWLAERRAKPHEPPSDFSEELPVQWWELRKAGFTALLYEQPLIDERWKLTGKPWRVLRRGDLRIPVMRSGAQDDRLYPKHRSRVAAQCHLLETLEGARSPYGVVLFPRSYHGIAIPNSPANRKLFHDALLDCRTLVSSAEDPPVERCSACVHCPCGAPRIYVEGESEHQLQGINLPVHPVTTPAGRVYHSLCGDRFRWLPPHQRSSELELTEE